MQSIEHVLKEGAETVLRAAMRSSRGRRPENLATYLEQLHAQGYAVVDNFWSADRCAKVVNNIEAALAGGHPCHQWIDDEKSDFRLYFAERMGGDFTGFFGDQTIDAVRSYYSGQSGGDQILMAARLKYAPGNKGSGGGWHRDSPHRSQFKAILYLTDVTSATGPFQYIVGSHRSSNAVKLLLDGLSKPNQYRFEEDEIEYLLKKTSTEPVTFCAPAGTLLFVDVKGIHRGRPIEDGRRYVLMKYFWDGARPAGFLQ